MKVAAYQAPLLPIASPRRRAIALIRAQLDWCEAQGVSILCCPEAVLGGLADYTPRPEQIAVERAELSEVLAPLSSETVTTIVGFTEAADGRFYNAAAIWHRGELCGVYRKRHPAINRSIYAAGDCSPVCRIGELVFGLLICNDSNHRELARHMTGRGAKALFVPTNNALPSDRANVVDEARRVDAALAAQLTVTVIRADVAGCENGLVSYGSTGITAPDGVLLQSARAHGGDVIVAVV